MPFFDHSKVIYPKNPFPTRTYQTYMSPSKREYLDHDETHGCQKQTWIVPGTNVDREKSLQQNITKLRNILSDTIASLTKENNLKKGESVELTLEIELMKSFGTSPANSLVEVTIIQHNKGRSADFDQQAGQRNKMHFIIDKNKDNQTTITSSPSPEKQQSWFRKVVSKEMIKGKPIRELEYRTKDKGKQDYKIQKKDIHKALFCPVAAKQDKENREIQDVKENFINVLPEGPPKTQNIMKGYQKVCKNSQMPFENKRLLPDSKGRLPKHNTLMKKISNIFVPAKKSNKNDKVEKGRTALKDEIEKIHKTENDSNHQNKNKINETSVVKLGKMVNNILFDVMDSEGNKAEPAAPLQYQRFFEPATKTSKKQKKTTKRKKSLPIRSLYRSHSDTCCIRPLRSEVETKVLSSNSISDCRSHSTANTPVKVACAGDAKREKRRKKSNHRDYSRGHRISMKGERKISTRIRDEGNPRDIVPHQNTMPSISSMIQWNGRNVKVSKDLKARIEMLIVNELENVALKEGMQCDLVPISSTDNTSKSSNTTEKMSSFVCELDVSDKNVKKIMKRKKSFQSKVSVHNSDIELVEMGTFNVHQGNCTVTSTATQTLPVFKRSNYNNDINENLIVKKEVNILNETQNAFNPDQIMDVRRESVEIKFMNKNMKNWSTESQAINIYRSDIMFENRRKKQSEKVGKDSPGKGNIFTSTGFVKVIRSDDSTWNKHLTQGSSNRSGQLISSHEWPDMKLPPVLCSSTSGKNEIASNNSTKPDEYIQIELDIQDLENILMEAKNKYNANKVLLEAKCANARNKPRSPKLIGKNSLSYTNQLLAQVAKKLEKDAKNKIKDNKLTKK